MFKLVYLALLLVRVILSSPNTENELLERTIKGLNKTLDFVLDDYEAMNVDGILGINVAQAHLRKTLLKVNDSSTRQKLTELIEKAKLIYELQGPNLRSSPYKYHVFNNHVIPPELWMHDINFSYGKLDPNPQRYTGPYNPKNLSHFIDYLFENTFGELSDVCLVEVAAATNDTKPHYCPISEVCVDYMLTMPTEYSDRFSGYGVTHMLLFLQIARARNCLMDRKVFNELVKAECSYILWELRQNVQFKYIPNLDDLLIEQRLCGTEGYGEFLEKAFLEHTLQIQNPHGGFDFIILSKKDIVNSVRRKRGSSAMKYGASNHTTGLAAAVLALYIRLLIEKPFSGRAFYVPN